MHFQRPPLRSVLSLKFGLARRAAAGGVHVGPRSRMHQEKHVHEPAWRRRAWSVPSRRPALHIIASRRLLGRYTSPTTATQGDIAATQVTDMPKDTGRGDARCVLLDGAQQHVERRTPHPVAPRPRGALVAGKTRPLPAVVQRGAAQQWARRHEQPCKSQS